MIAKLYYYKRAEEHFVATYGYDAGIAKYRNITFPLRDEEMIVTKQSLIEELDHVLIYELEVPAQLEGKDNLAIAEFIFSMFNYEHLNPLCTDEGQRTVRAKRTHTSMSVGDCVQIGDRFFYCANFGFKEVE